MKMVQMAKSTKYFELFLRRNPGTFRVSTENSKEKVILVRCAIFILATADFRIIAEPVSRVSLTANRNYSKCQNFAAKFFLLFSPFKGAPLIGSRP